MKYGCEMCGNGREAGMVLAQKENEAKDKKAKSSITKQVKEAISGFADQVVVSGAGYKAGKEFYYRNGKSSGEMVEQIKAALPQAVIVAHGEIDKPFNGGGSTFQNSHFWVQFSVKG